MNDNKKISMYDDIYTPKIIFPTDINEPEETPENISYYAVDENGVMWFYCGNWRTRVMEHFADCGKQIGTLIEDAVKFEYKILK